MITTIEYNKLLLFINLFLSKSRFKGTIQAGDIANSIFVEHPKMAFSGMVELVKKYLNKAINEERTARLNARALRQKKAIAKIQQAEKKATNPEYKAKCNERTNNWEKDKRKNNATWKKKRNKKQRDKKREQRKNKKKPPES